MCFQNRKSPAEVLLALKPIHSFHLLTLYPCENNTTYNARDFNLPLREQLEVFAGIPSIRGTPRGLGDVEDRIVRLPFCGRRFNAITFLEKGLAEGLPWNVRGIFAGLSWI